ncbi:unnamed protein product [Lactuca saligna]|uniref:VAL1-3 N-terminal zinc finger domain-containing protein n=1 Tax=Lactuca saligna TaxID=75948 RepID=A0AA35UV58_LACSI|nr:unnamed protein product [Lactuca saligna]CAI9268322.1 unnamed protein product [Lactuca saligna]
MNLLLCAADVMEIATPRRFSVMIGVVLGDSQRSDSGIIPLSKRFRVFWYKPVHCGYVASKYLHECIDLGGISSIKCIRARGTQALTPMQSNPTDIPNGFIPFSASWHSYVISNRKNENSMVMSFIDRKTLQNSADDYPKIVDLLCRFSIHHKNVSFSCRKHGAGATDVHSVAMSTRLDAIISVYGVSVARSLMKIEASFRC